MLLIKHTDNANGYNNVLMGLNMKRRRRAGSAESEGNEIYGFR